MLLVFMYQGMRVLRVRFPALGVQLCFIYILVRAVCVCVYVCVPNAQLLLPGSVAFSSARVHTCPD